MTRPLSELGALRSLGDEQDLTDAGLLLEIVGEVEQWSQREPRIRSASSKLFAYSFGAVWSDKRSGTPTGWRFGWTGLPWSAAARSLLAVEGDRIIIRRENDVRDPLSLEHVVPKGLIFAELRSMHGSATPRDVVDFLHENTRIAVVTKAEGKGLGAGEPLGDELHRRAVMRRKGMPDDAYLASVTAAGLPWQWARYVEVGHRVESFALLRDADDLADGVRALLPPS